MALLLDIQLDFPATNFQRVGLARRILIPNLTTDGTFESCRFINGNFYLATKGGGFRITPSGVVTKLFPHWAKDFFADGNKLYSSAANAYDFHFSTDNGVTWTRGTPSSLQYVETPNGKVLTQTQRNQRFGLADSTMTKIADLTYNPNFSKLLDNYYNVVYFKGKYFLSDDTKVFALDSLRRK